MNEKLNERCHMIIHSHAAAAAAGNLNPVPGLGIAADITAMTSMCMSLASVMERISARKWRKVWQLQL